MRLLLPLPQMRALPPNHRATAEPFGYVKTAHWGYDADLVYARTHDGQAARLSCCFPIYRLMATEAGDSGGAGQVSAQRGMHLLGRSSRGVVLGLGSN